MFIIDLDDHGHSLTLKVVAWVILIQGVMIQKHDIFLGMIAFAICIPFLENYTILESYMLLIFGENDKRTN